MLFRIIAVLSIVGLAGRLAYIRFREETFIAGARAGSLSWSAYFSWVLRKTSSHAGSLGWRSLRALYDYCLTFHTRPLMKAVFSGLAWSAFFLALSGIGFALFSPRGLFGVFLLLHVIAGGIFAVCLAAEVVLRAKEYNLALEVLAHGRRPFWPFQESSSPPLNRSLFFWGFALAGLVLTVTALSSMVPYFSLDTQLTLTAVHRWSGLVAVLAAMLFFDAVLPRPER